MNRAALILVAPLGLGLALAGCGDKSAKDANMAAADNAVTPVDNAAVTGTPPVAGNAAAPATGPVDLSSWQGLETAVGRYPAEIKLYEASVLTAPLKALLGDEYDDFLENMGVSGPLSKEGVLFATGNKPHEGGSDAAFILIDPATQKLEVGIWDDGKFKSYASPGALMNRPKDVKTMIGNMRDAAKTPGA